MMEVRERHRGRLIDHLGLIVRDFAASKAFYTAVFHALEVPIGGSDDHDLWVDELFISARESNEVEGQLTGRHHLAFQARDQAMVDAFYEAAMAHGGRDNGPPGERPYHVGYYAAYVLDPDGNNIEAVSRGQVERSTDSVVLKIRIESRSSA
jgi:catechol 2,3-dioxygenase-like lactoylglutathione lyase family enzyme